MTIDAAPMTPANPPNDERWISNWRVASGSDRRRTVSRIGSQQLIRAVGHATTDHDQRRVEEVDDAGQHRTDPPTGRFEDRDGDRIAE